jgi:hypothetical protein
MHLRPGTCRVVVLQIPEAAFGSTGEVSVMRGVQNASIELAQQLHEYPHTAAHATPQAK